MTRAEADTSSRPSLNHGRCGWLKHTSWLGLHIIKLKLWSRLERLNQTSRLFERLISVLSRSRHHIYRLIYNPATRNQKDKKYKAKTETQFKKPMTSTSCPSPIPRNAVLGEKAGLSLSSCWMIAFDWWLRHIRRVIGLQTHTHACPMISQYAT